MPHAGTGRDLSEARSPAYLDTPRGRVALLSVTSTGPQGMRAGEQWRDGRGRPGANLLRYTTAYTVDRPTFDALRRMSEALGFEARKAYRAASPAWAGPVTEDTDTRFFLPNLNDENQCPDPDGNLFMLGDDFRIHHLPDEEDIEGNLERVRDARRQADWVIVSMHTHEQGRTDDDPSQMVVDFARACIDAGADVFSGHGPHLDRGIEIYRGKPIFYSLGHLVFENETVSRTQWEGIRKTSLGPESTPADYYDARSGREAPRRVAGLRRGGLSLAERGGGHRLPGEAARGGEALPDRSRLQAGALPAGTPAPCARRGRAGRCSISSAGSRGLSARTWRSRGRSA